MKKASCAAVLVCAVAGAQPIVIKTSTILDGKGGILRNKMIVVEGGHIARVADARGTAKYDLTGLTVMPGWIDTHVHLGWHFNQEGRLEQGKESPEQAALFAAGNAHAT